MKEVGFLIHSSWEGRTKTSELIKGLKSVKTGAEGLDVYEEEEGIFFYRPFIRFDN